MGYDRIDSENCAVIGYGSWATAIVKTLTVNGRRVEWYVRNDRVLDSLRATGHNPKYLPYVGIDRSLIAPSNDLNAVVAASSTVVLAAPSAFL